MVRDDYEKIKWLRSDITCSLVADFNKIIRKKIKRYHNYRAIANSWAFEYIECESETSIAGETVISGCPVIITEFVGEESVRRHTESPEATIRLSVTSINSTSKYADVNPEILEQIRHTSRKPLYCDFNPELPTDVNKIHLRNEPKAKKEEEYATLTCGEYVYPMLEPNIIVSGSNDRRSGRNIIKIRDEDVIDSHIQIRYNPQNDYKFQIATLGETRLNERKLMLNTWYPLADHSKIFLNGVVSLHFDINNNRC